ncbi:MAG: glycosyltransferase [Lachnospiraceae bacterium]|nr:glycosyltransferase [Lachnospiraceae bacterium]
MRNIVVYFGIMFLPDKNALCQRAKSILKSAKELGYETVAIGVSDEVEVGTYRKQILGKEIYYEVCYPTNIYEWINHLTSSKEIIEIIREIGCEKVKSFIVADYRFIPTVQMNEFCKKEGINFVADIMDWFIPGNDIISLIKQIDTALRIHLIYPKIERKICICTNFAKKYKSTKYMQIIPGTVDINDSKWPVSSCRLEENFVNLIFAGQPGKKCKKEKIDWVIRAMYNVDTNRKLNLYLLGVEEGIFKKENPKLCKYIEKINIHFIGKVDHLKCIEMISNADFSLVVRAKNRLSEYGFSTKISEAFACGTAVLATDTSDVKLYVKNTINGFVCNSSYVGVECMIKQILKLSREEIRSMNEKVRENNKLIFSEYTELLRKVL